MPLPAPPQTTDDTGNVQSPENAVPSVRRTTTEKILGGIGRGADMLTGTPPTEFGQSMVGKLLDEHYQQRLNDARRHYVDKQAYAEILHRGTGPDGKDLSDEDRADYERRLAGATQDFAKAAGVNKDIKAQIEQQDDAHNTIYQATRTHGTGVVHGLLTRLGVIQGGKDGAAAPAEPPDANGVPAQPMGKPATSESLGVGKTGMPAPPPYDVADLAPMEQGQARSVVGQTATGLGARTQIAEAIGLAPKPGEPPTAEYQRFIIEGKMPASTSLQLMGDRVPGKNVPPNAITLDGTPVDPNGFYRLQREPYSGTVIATTASLTAGQANGQQFTYKGPNGEPLVAVRHGNSFLDQQNQPLPPNTEVWEGANVPRTTTTKTFRIVTDKDGNQDILPITESRTVAPANLPGYPKTDVPSPATPAKAGLDGVSGTAPAPAGAAPANAKSKSQAATPSLTPPAGVGKAQAIIGPDGEPLHKQLSAAARTGIGNVIIAEDLMDQILPELNQVVSDIKSKGGDPNSWFKSAEERSAWEQYAHGVDPSQISEDSILAALPNIDPRLAKLFPKLALLTITGSQPYLRNVRNYNYVTDIRQHLPNLTADTPKNMQSKMFALMDNLPNLERAAYEQEGVKSKPFQYATPAKVQAYADKKGLSYADAAHYFRRGGYKISHE